VSKLEPGSSQKRHFDSNTIALNDTLKITRLFLMLKMAFLTSRDHF